MFREKFKPDHVVECDVLVVGGGSAGCFAAIKAKEEFPDSEVVIAEKAYVGRSGSSPFAAGAINICVPEDDKQVWLEEIVERGEYLNDQEWVKIYLDESYDLAEELHSWGKGFGKTVFEKDEKGNYIRRKARGNINTLTSIVNALDMMDTLRRQALKMRVKLVERTMVTNLIVKDGSVVGAVGFNYHKGESYLFMAKAVVLAAAGCGFKGYLMGHRNLTGEAQHMAFEVGAELRNLDQAMSNSTARELDVHGMSLMVGMGGRFLNGKGEEFMLKYDPQVGSRARLTKLTISMAREVSEGNGPIYMDLTALSPPDQELLRKVVPEGFRAFDSAGINPFKEKVEWMPAFLGTLIHGGGVHIDIRSATNIPGLYAAGDTTCTPEHGTWSITGLNITFCFISGARSGKFAAQYAANTTSLSPDDQEVIDQVAGHIEVFQAPLGREKGFDPDEVIRHIQEIMIPYPVAYLRNAARLEEALGKIETIRKEEIPQLKASDWHELMKANETRPMVVIAEMILRSVLSRQESRGFVYREDYPMTDNCNWLKWIMVKKANNGMEVYTKEFETPYVEPPREIYPCMNW